MTTNPRPRRNKDRTVISLEDLAPRKDPRGGGGISEKAVFGEGPIMTGTNERKAAEKKVRRER